MAIVEAVISADILGLINDLNTGDPTQKTAAETNQAFADGLATIIKDAITSGKATVPAATFLIGATAGVPNPAPVPLSIT